MRDLEITVTGWAATSPAMVVRRDGSTTDMATFRVAQTPRRYNPSTNEWADGRTEWFDVRVRRDAAAFVVSSVEKGQPVVVTGRLRTEEWSGQDGTPRWAMRVEATAVGHDLTRGTARFQRATVDSSVEVTPAPPKADGAGPDSAAVGGVPGAGMPASFDAEADEADEVDEVDEVDGEEAKEPVTASV